MTNEMVLEKKSNLVMPSHYVELDREEMAYVDGGGFSLKKVLSTITVLATFASSLLSFCKNSQLAITVSKALGLVGATSAAISITL